MAFSQYIQLGGYLYKTLAKEWKPSVHRPATARLTLSGELEGTFGIKGTLRWEGVVIAQHSENLPPGPADGTRLGNIVSLRQDLKSNADLAFKDHNGISHRVIALGPFEEQSMLNVWNSPSNKYYVRVTLVSSY